MSLSVCNALLVFFTSGLTVTYDVSHGECANGAIEYIRSITRSCRAPNDIRSICVIESFETQVKNIALPHITNLETSPVVFEATRNIILIRFRLMKKVREGDRRELEYLIRKYVEVMKSQNFRIGRINKLMYKLRDKHCDNQPVEIIDAILNWIIDIQEKLLISNTNILNLDLILKKMKLRFLTYVCRIILENNDYTVLYANLPDIISIFLKISNMYVQTSTHKNVSVLENMYQELRFHVRTVWINIHTDYHLYLENLRIMLENRKSCYILLYEDIYMSNFYISLFREILRFQDSTPGVFRHNFLNTDKINSLYDFVEGTGTRTYCYDEIIIEEFKQLFDIALRNSRRKHDKVRKYISYSISSVLDELSKNREGLVIFIRSLDLYEYFDITSDEYDYEKCSRILKLLKSYLYFLVHDDTITELTAAYNCIFPMNFICYAYNIHKNMTLYIEYVHILLKKCSKVTRSTISIGIKHVIYCYIDQNTTKKHFSDEQMYQKFLCKTIDVFNIHVGQISIIKSDTEAAILSICYKFRSAFENLKEYVKVKSLSDKYRIFRTIGDSIHSIIFSLYYDLRAFEGINNLETAENIQRFFKDFAMHFLCSFVVPKDSPNRGLIYKFMMTLIMYINGIEDEVGKVNDANLQSILVDTIIIMSTNNFLQIYNFIQESLSYIIGDLDQKDEGWKLKSVFLAIFKKFETHMHNIELRCKEIQNNLPIDFNTFEKHFRRDQIHNPLYQLPESNRELEETLSNFTKQLDELIAIQYYNMKNKVKDIKNYENTEE